MTSEKSGVHQRPRRPGVRCRVCLKTIHAAGFGGPGCPGGSDVMGRQS